MIHSGTFLRDKPDGGVPALSPEPPVVTVMTACPDFLTHETEEALRTALNGEELSRLASLRDDDARQQYLVAHVLLRCALSSQQPVSLSSWQFRRVPSGAPVVAAPLAAMTLSFSLSHTRSLVVCAVSATCKVGVDVEKIEEAVDVHQLALHVLSKGERDEWDREAQSRQAERFYFLWTLKEAFLKAVGQGLRTPPDAVGFRLQQGLHPELVCLPRELGAPGDWSFRTLEISDVHACALAIRITPGKPFLIHLEHASLEELVQCTRAGHGLTPCCAVESALVARRAR